MSRQLPLALLAALGVACASPGTSEPPSVSRAGVVGGEPSAAGGIEDAVLLLRVALDGGELVCSSSLIAENLAVTARHCVSNFVEGNFRCTTQGELVSTDPNAGELGSHFEPSTIEFYDGRTPRTKPVAYGAQVLSTQSETICTNDLAFVLLDRSLSLPVLPLRLNGRARIGEPATLVGYGFDDAMVSGDFLDVATQPRTHNTSLVIDDVGPVANADVTSMPPRSILIQGPSGCVGDSGGPLLARDTHALLGVDSLSHGGDCLSARVQNLFTHVPDFKLLLADAFTLAGHEPTPEAPPDEPASMSEAGRGGAANEPEAGGAPAAGAETNGPAAGGSATHASSGGSATHAAGGNSAELAGAAASEAGAPGSAGGAPGATNAAGDGAGARARVPATRARHGGCSLASGAPPSATAWPFVVLVSVLERVFRIRRRGRVVFLRNAPLRRE